MVEISCDLSLIDNTTGREFETFIVKLFEKLGYSTTVTNRSKDHGCDMMLQQGEYRIAVQAKRSESELNFTSSGAPSTVLISTDFSKAAEVISKAVVRLYCNILSAPIPVIYILVPSGLNVIPVALPSSSLISRLAINVGSAKASDEKNKLNKTKNTFSLRAPFIINFLLFFIKLSILIY